MNHLAVIAGQVRSASICDFNLTRCHFFMNEFSASRTVWMTCSNYKPRMHMVRSCFSLSHAASSSLSDQINSHLPSRQLTALVDQRGGGRGIFCRTLDCSRAFFSLLSKRNQSSRDELCCTWKQFSSNISSAFPQALDNVPVLLYILALKTLLLCLAFAGVKIYQSKKAEEALKKQQAERRRLAQQTQELIDNKKDDWAARRSCCTQVAYQITHHTYLQSASTSFRSLSNDHRVA